MAESEGKGAAVDGRAEEEDEALLMEEVAVLDFDMMCSTVAMQTHLGKWSKLDSFESDGGGGGEFAGVLRMWEGELLDCFDDRRIAIQSACCPCFRFGKNMRRAGLGSCFIQGTVYLAIAVTALLNFMAYVLTKKHRFLYLGVAFTISIPMYLGFHRTQIRKKFNIKGSYSSIDDCFYHMICPCCALSQESRTLEMNNVQEGTWHGRGDTICIGSYGTKSLSELCSPPIISV